MNNTSSFYPNFFIVGAPRSATTSLYEYLNKHPQIIMSKIKEPHFFGKDLFDPKFIRNEKDYLSLFQVENQKIIGEASVWYLYSKYAAEEIQKFNPDSKILISLRNPNEMIFSLHFQHVRSGFQKTSNFEKAIKEQNKKPVKNRISFRENINYFESAKYSEQIKRYQKVFDPNQIKIVLFDDIVVDTAKIYREILQFLEVDPDFLPEFPILNKRKNTRNKYLDTVVWNLRRMRSSIKKTNSTYFKSMSKIWYFSQNLNQGAETRERIDTRIPSELKSYFKNEIKVLGEIINRDLNSWLI